MDLRIITLLAVVCLLLAVHALLGHRRHKEQLRAYAALERAIYALSPQSVRSAEPSKGFTPPPVVVELPEGNATASEDDAETVALRRSKLPLAPNGARASAKGKP